jgi:hypothetical protein
MNQTGLGITQMVDIMEKKKTIEVYGSFEEWVRAHKHSSSSISCALEDALQAGEDNPIESMESYISGLSELRSEIKAEISEARDWIGYFKKQKR